MDALAVGARMSEAAPFRELFVELPRAIFEALQGMAEVAVHRAEDAQRAPLSRGQSATETLKVFVAAVRDRYGWQRTVVERAPYDAAWLITVKLACGHLHRISIDEHWWHSLSKYDLAPAFVDRLDREADHRSCTCVARPS